MNRYSISNKKTVSDRIRKARFLEKNLSDEAMKTSLRRAVKSICVPADLETKVLNLLRKQL